MKIISKWWVRLIIAFFVCGAIGEGISVSTGKELNPIIAMLILFAIYLGLSFMYGFYLRKQNQTRDDIIDNDL